MKIRVFVNMRIFIVVSLDFLPLKLPDNLLDLLVVVSE